MKEIKKTNTLSSAPNPKMEDIIYQQSANVLFNFMPKIDYLKDKLKRKAMLPRYYEEPISYLELQLYDTLAFPMICFCDIHLNRLHHHMGTKTSEIAYGRYGIGMNKNWGQFQGLQPINYILESSPIMADMKIALEYAITELNAPKMPYDVLTNFVLTILLYTKPINGTMAKTINSNKQYITKNFHDEREWRFIPRFEGVKTELPLIISPDKMKSNINNSVCDAHSNGIKEAEDLWLKFDYKDVKYLIVDTTDDADNLIEFIMNDLEVDKKQKYILLSKIMVFTQIEKDW